MFNVPTVVPRYSAASFCVIKIFELIIYYSFVIMVNGQTQCLTFINTIIMKETKNRTNHGFATCDRFYIQKTPHKILIGSIFVYINLRV